jgi:hypothetical protein
MQAECVVQPLGLAEIPPHDVWDLYIWFLFIPMLMRAVLLTKPFLTVTKQLAPHGGWVLKRLKELPVRGFGLLAFNEVLAFILPITVVLILRFATDPLGWPSWAESNWLGLILLFAFASLWIILDLYRILRVRRMLKTIEKQNIKRLRKIADTGFKLRDILRKFSRRDKDDSEVEDTVTTTVAKNSLKTWGLLAFKARKLTPTGLVGAVATGAAIELSRRGAGMVSDRIDEKMQEEFEKISVANSKTLVQMFLRDFMMGIAPLFALWLIPWLLP